MSGLYPENLLPLIREELPASYAAFAELREQVLLEYRYPTARAYWGDLDDIYRWAIERDKDVLALSEKDIRQYVTLLRRRQYSDNTIRRRVTALRKLYDLLRAEDGSVVNCAANVVISRRAK
ncbi:MULTISPECIES: site-specific integrase [unclassified Mycolicibacterium]|uniref:site-specific integrase n=1 Tax=unclassified Mycolicibacterium TaxID=2636767 RepID=UPI0016166129|nr:site-specific recombinase XerD [Mycolicibacterium sp. BK607]